MHSYVHAYMHTFMYVTKYKYLINTQQPVLHVPEMIFPEMTCHFLDRVNYLIYQQHPEDNENKSYMICHVHISLVIVIAWARVPMILLICYTSGTLKICITLTLIFQPLYIRSNRYSL